MLAVGHEAPAFCLPNQDEVEICLKDLVGKWIVLYFYPKDSTPGCTTEACDFTEALPEFEQMDAVVLGVSPDSAKSHRNFIAKKGLQIPLLSDSSTAMCATYGVWQMKKMCGREYMGVVRTTYLIAPDGTIAHIWSDVKVKGHAEAVKAKLATLR